MLSIAISIGTFDGSASAGGRPAAARAKKCSRAISMHNIRYFRRMTEDVAEAKIMSLKQMLIYIPVLIKLSGPAAPLNSGPRAIIPWCTMPKFDKSVSCTIPGL